MNKAETLDDFKDMRANKCFFGFLSIPVAINHDATHTMVYDAHFFSKSNPGMKFINEFSLPEESGFLASALTTNGMKAALSSRTEDIMGTIDDMVARSLLLSVLIESRETIHLIFQAPIPIGVTDRKELTRNYDIVFRKSTGKRGWKKNAEIRMYALASAVPVSEDIRPGKTFFRVGGNNVDSHPEAVGLESVNSEADVMLRLELPFPDASDTDGKGGLSRAADDEVRRAMELCGFISEGRKDCFKVFPDTVIGTYPDHAAGKTMFSPADDPADLASLAKGSAVTEILPEDDGRIFMILETEHFRYVAMSCAYDDEEYIMRRIDGRLKAVGPVDRVQEKTKFYTAAFAPAGTGNGQGTEEYVFSGAFPGRPDINPLLDGLEEGDMLYGSEVNARRLQPIVPGS